MGRFLNILSLIILFSIKVWGTTWEIAYPYTQSIKGQNITIQAYSYDPYHGSPAKGLTKVYRNGTLLYTIDKYYREPVFTSDNGEYFAVVYTNNTQGVTSNIDFGQKTLFRPAIEILKNGKPFKNVLLNEVIDTNKIYTNGYLYWWGYYVNVKAFDNAQDGCEACMEVYGQKILKKCDSNEIDPTECKECREECDSVRLKDAEMNIYRNSVFVKNDTLFVLTNQNTVVCVSMVDLTYTQVPFEIIVPNKSLYNPPKVVRKYRKVKMPDKFDCPNLKDGRTLEKGIADWFKVQYSNITDSEIFGIYIYSIVVNKQGYVIGPEVNIYDRRISKENTDNAVNKEMTEKLKIWLEQQVFQTKLIPKRFEKYSFLCIIDLLLPNKKAT